MLRGNIFIKYFLSDKYFLFHLTSMEHAPVGVRTHLCMSISVLYSGSIFDCIKSKGWFPHTTRLCIMRSIQKQTIQSVLLKTSLVDEFENSDTICLVETHHSVQSCYLIAYYEHSRARIKSRHIVHNCKNSFGL